MTVRDDLAAAADSVEGIDANAFYIPGTHAGHTFVRLERIAYPNPFGGIRHWNVITVLPPTLGEAERFLEEKVPLLREALEPHLVITEVVPQQLQLDADRAPLLCVFLNGHREE